MLILALVCVESSIRFTLASITPAFRAISMVVEINTSNRFASFSRIWRNLDNKLGFIKLTSSGLYPKKYL